jgi:hypothetical protein
VLPPVLGSITPYRRLCGAIFMSIAAVVAPNLYFVMTLLFSSRVAGLSIWAVLALYFAIILIPAVRRVSPMGSFVALGATGVLITLSTINAAQIKHVLAVSVGFYDDLLPWVAAPTQATGTECRNEFAGFSLRVPQNWTQRNGPLAGTIELTLVAPDTGRTKIRLRPTCDRTEAPLAVTVVELPRDRSDLQRKCGRWQGLDSCLLDYGVNPSAAGSPEHWEWLAHDTARGVNVRLMIDLFDSAHLSDVLPIIQSVRPASKDFSATGCPNPSEWTD